MKRRPLLFPSLFIASLLAALLVLPAPAQTPNATVENGNGTVRLQSFYNGGFLTPGTRVNDGTENDSIPAEGAGVRMMWYPEKAAFRAGQVGNTSPKEEAWDAFNIGVGSVAFGVDTEASGFGATAMGVGGIARGDFATAMGIGGLASGDNATAMGRETIASGDEAAAMGENTTASGAQATAMGDGTTASGDHATAMGDGTTASGFIATAMGNFTTASEIGAMAMGNQTTASGPVATTMGEGTIAATGRSLSIGECNSANSGSSGDGTLFVAGNGDFSAGSCSRSDAMVLKKSGDFGLGPSDPDARLHARDNVSGPGGDPNNHAGFIENTGGGGSDGLAIQTGDSSPSSTDNFLTFFAGDGDAVGAIEGDGSGGITTISGGSDFAEELPVTEGAVAPKPADIIGVHGGEASLQTDDADRVMIASTAPIMTGNADPSKEAVGVEAVRKRVPVAFVGQVPAKVRGPAQPGDLIVPSGEEDGTGRALDPADYRRKEHGPVAGQAWEAKATEEVGEVTVAVGLSRSGAVAEQMEKQRDRIAELEAENDEIRAENEEIKERLAALEAKQQGALPADLVGPWGLALLLGLGGLAAGLLWRRRG